MDNSTYEDGTGRMSQNVDIKPRFSGI